MEFSPFGAKNQVFGDSPVKLILSYKDGLGTQYETEQMIDPQKDFSSWRMGKEILMKLTKAIEKLTAKL